MKLGLVLAGGGGKGAYEVGAWRAFKEYGIEFDSIAGASIGALNGLFMAMDQLDYCHFMWNGLGDLMATQVASSLPRVDEQALYYIDQSFKNPASIKEHIDKKGFINSQPMEMVIKGALLKFTIKKNFYVSAVNADTIETEYFSLKDQDPDHVAKCILASASIPLIFDAVNIQDQHYYDGGILDNTPIKPLLEEGCDMIFVIFLKTRDMDCLKIHTSVPLVPIIPSEYLGNFQEGTMNFKKEDIHKRIELGYEDTKRILEGLKFLCSHK